jgi:hypothetical protein
MGPKAEQPPTCGLPGSLVVSGSSPVSLLAVGCLLCSVFSNSVGARESLQKI